MSRARGGSCKIAAVLNRAAITLTALLITMPIVTASAQTLSPEQRDAPPARQPAAPRDPQPAPVAPARGCQTERGVCQLECCVAPGTPCRCLDANGNVVSGYAVEFFRPSR